MIFNINSSFNYFYNNFYSFLFFPSVLILLTSQKLNLIHAFKQEKSKPRLNCHPGLRVYDLNDDTELQFRWKVPDLYHLLTWKSSPFCPLPKIEQGCDYPLFIQLTDKNTWLQKRLPHTKILSSRSFRSSCKSETEEEKNDNLKKKSISCTSWNILR